MLLCWLSFTQFRDGFNRGAMGKVVLHPEDDERDPDDDKSDQKRLVEWFLVDKYADQELKRWRYVLQQANNGERNFLRSRGKQQKRNGRYRTCTDQQQRGLRAILEE